MCRSGTVGRLERGKVGADSIYKSYPVLVVSIDFVKSDRNRHLFLMDCPEFVIVDEAHGAAVADPANANQQQRHQLLSELASNPKQRHLVLLTATPHSGIAGAFRSLLGLLRPDFANFDPGTLSEAQRIELARHFVQRTRKDIETEWKDEQPFPIPPQSSGGQARAPSKQIGYFRPASAFGQPSNKTSCSQLSPKSYSYLKAKRSPVSGKMSLSFVLVESTRSKSSSNPSSKSSGSP